MRIDGDNLEEIVKTVCNAALIITFLLILGYCSGCVAPPAPPAAEAQWGPQENIEAVIWLQDIGVDYVAESLKDDHCACLRRSMGHTCH